MTGFLAVLQSVALPVDLHDVHVVQQSIEQRRGERRIIGERRGPLRERQVAGHDRAGPLITLGDGVEEQVRLLAAKGQITEIVDHQQPRLDHRPIHVLGDAPLGLRQRELDHQVRRGDEARLDARLRRLQRQGAGEVGLADA